MEFSRCYRINSIRFTIGLIGYAVVSHAVFLITSTGWLDLMLAYFGIFYWGSLILITILLLLFRFFILKRNFIYLHKMYLRIIFPLQALVYIFNVDDCGSPFIMTWIRNFSEIFLQKETNVLVSCAQQNMYAVGTYIESFEKIILLTFLTLLTLFTITSAISKNSNDIDSR